MIAAFGKLAHDKIDAFRRFIPVITAYIAGDGRTHEKFGIRE